RSRGSCEPGRSQPCSMPCSTATLIWWCSGVGLCRCTTRASRSSTVTVITRQVYKVIIFGQACRNEFVPHGRLVDEPLRALEERPQDGQPTGGLDVVDAPGTDRQGQGQHLAGYDDPALDHGLVADVAYREGCGLARRHDDDRLLDAEATGVVH